jgi:hypothetical protein
VEKMLGDSFFVSACREWNRFKRFGLPHGKGYMGERRLYVRAIEIMEQEFNDWQYRRMKHGGS